MKKWLAGCMLGGIFLTSNISPVFAEEVISQTEVSITFVRQISPGELPGMEGNISNSPSIVIAKPTSSKNLPKTNEQVRSTPPLLVFLFVGCSCLLWQCRNRKDEN